MRNNDSVKNQALNHPKNQLDLPEPDSTAKEYSKKLVEVINTEIHENDGIIGFDRFMDMALYEPGLGYYSAGARKFGIDGDFTTAPEISPVFSYCIARQCLEVFEITGADRILELGAGSGAMACDLLSELKRFNALPAEYLILETSADLKQRQYQTLKERQPEILERVKWLDTLPEERFSGIILANEVLDAFPVHKISVSDKKINELKVTNENDCFGWEVDKDVDGILISESYSRLEACLDTLDDAYITEVNLLIKPFLRSLSEILSTGAVLFVDYGYSRKEYYHPQRSMGTLVCHYRHRSHDNPLILVGCQDISAFVDFTSVAESAHEVGMDVHGYISQTGFLISCGIEDIINSCRSDDEKLNLQIAQQAGKLMLPGEMGEKFKVMGLTRNITVPLKGFLGGNSVHRL